MKTAIFLTFLFIGSVLALRSNDLKFVRDKGHRPQVGVPPSLVGPVPTSLVAPVPQHHGPRVWGYVYRSPCNHGEGPHVSGYSVYYSSSTPHGSNFGGFGPELPWSYPQLDAYY